MSRDKDGRVGDATRGRIERLADGWALPVRDDRVGDKHQVREVRTEELDKVEDIEIVDDDEIDAAAARLPTVIADGDEVVGRPPPRPSPTDRAPTVQADVLAVLETLEADAETTGRRPVPLPDDADEGDEILDQLITDRVTPVPERHEGGERPGLPLPAPASTPVPERMVAAAAEAATTPQRLLTPLPDGATTPQRLMTPLPSGENVDLDAIAEEELVEDVIEEVSGLEIVGESRRDPSSMSMMTPLPPPAPSKTEPWERLQVGSAKEAELLAPLRKAAPAPTPSSPAPPAPLPVPRARPGARPAPRAAAPTHLTPSAAPDDPTRFEHDSSSSAQASEPARPATPLAERRGGTGGDIRYAFAVIRGLVAGRREASSIRERLALERGARKRRLLELARIAVGEAAITGSEIDEARDRLVWHEQQRAGYAEAVQAAEAEATEADGEREAEAKQATRTLAELNEAIAAVDERLRPLDRDMAERKKALAELRGQISAVQKRIDGIEKKLNAARDGAERAGFEAELAPARAERAQLIAEEPARQEAVAELAPKIEAELAEKKRLAGEVQATKESAAAADARLAAAARAARAEKERQQAAQKGAEAARDAELEQVAAWVEQARPAALRSRLRPVDEHGAAIKQLERRLQELEAAAAAVDKWALVRGLGVVALSIVAMAMLIAVIQRLT